MVIGYRYFEGQHSNKFVSFTELDKMVQFLVENDVLNYLYDCARAEMVKTPEECKALPQVDIVVDAQIVGHINITHLLNSQGYYIGNTLYCPEFKFACGTTCTKQSCPKVNTKPITSDYL